VKPNLQEFEGFCLVASPRMVGPPFGQSLILITHHEPEGTLGVIFNQATRHRLGDFLTTIAPQLKDAPIYEGGPVEKNILTLIGLNYSGHKLIIRSHLTPDFADEFLKHHETCVQVCAYLGYSGWAPGQLQEEIERGDWLLLPFTPALLEPITGRSLWQWAVGQLK